MIGLSYIMGSLSVLHRKRTVPCFPLGRRHYHFVDYPWNEVKSVCDVGASVGTVSMPLSKKYPHLKIINQDLPEVLVQAKDVSTYVFVLQSACLRIARRVSSR